MSVAALVLLAVGTADLVRQFLRPAHRIVGFAVVGVAIVILGAFAGAWPAALLAAAIAAAWILLFPSDAPARLGLWPIVVVAVTCGVFVAVLGDRPDGGLIGRAWSLPSPFGELSIDQTLLAIGTLCFLLESANVVVRAALSAEMRPAPTLEASDDGAATQQSAVPSRQVLKGGRLIGPLERVIVFSLTLAGVYTLLAAVLAAKGIVRFPEISRDGGSGTQAEYFLVGSLVSWVIALAAAFLVWWAFTTG
jgi:hypothetical protein